MERNTPRAMAAAPASRMLLLCLAVAATAGVLQARAQPDSNGMPSKSLGLPFTTRDRSYCIINGITAQAMRRRAPCTTDELDLRSGFISIDCGLPGTASYVDDTTKLAYAPDGGFTDAGSNHNISAEYITPTLAKRYHNVRSFPDGARNCYTLRSIVAQVPPPRHAATFKYGNYDGLARPPIFDLYIGVNFWTIVNVTDADSAIILEAIVLVPDDFVQVCLVNTGTGTPFISGLDLRPLKSTLYPQANATQGLVLYNRLNFGPTNSTAIIR